LAEENAKNDHVEDTMVYDEEDDGEDFYEQLDEKRRQENDTDGDDYVEKHYHDVTGAILNIGTKNASTFMTYVVKLLILYFF